MAVTFISNGYDTTTANPYTESAWADAHPAIGQGTYAVRSPLHWKVTAVAGADRTVSIAPGQGVGHGITDKTFDNETIQLDTISSGSRWDLIAVRRDWTPTAGESKFVKVNGGANAVLPGGRLYGPGNIDDQPIALVQVTSGQTQPTSIIDLRTWVGDGGGLIAAHDLVRTFLNKAGTRLWIDGVDWVRRVGANDNPEWEEVRGIKHAEFTASTVPFTNTPRSPTWGTGPLTVDAAQTTTNSGFSSPSADRIQLPGRGLYAVQAKLKMSAVAQGTTYVVIANNDGTFEYASVDIPAGTASGATVTIPNLYVTSAQVIRIIFYSDTTPGYTLASRVRVSKVG
ncbi:hypothetical protein [Pseudarthrobacter sp. NamE5]|uniref:hypothetical protein n=1 Tax=Pseudarthrobacter sp. NamE5 TaxID=2576839 RepID=UPI00110B15F2|nr:hypothetical protein [Pseudarthrobacter sp. NamE5]TLM87205.1 hypothetical protein FDW84_05260 [Pseudarthrobacter sp. NamE5]